MGCVIFSFVQHTELFHGFDFNKHSMYSLSHSHTHRFLNAKQNSSSDQVWVERKSSFESRILEKKIWP